MNQTERRQRGRPKSQFSDAAPPVMRALDRALSVLTELASAGPSALTDISQTLDIPPATTHRILATLQKHGYAELEEATQLWMVGVEAYRTGSAYINRTDLLDVSRPVMRRLMQATGETANLAIPDDGEVVFVGQVETQDPIRAFFAPGTRTPMHASGTGKALLAAMDEEEVGARIARMDLAAFTANTLATGEALSDDLAHTRARGWSFDREERHLGMSCIGAVIYDEDRSPVAGVSISGPSSRFSDDRIEALGKKVAAAALEITRAIGGKPGPGAPGFSLGRRG